MKLGRSGIGVSETIVPRIIQAPVRSSAPLMQHDGPALHLQPRESLTMPPTTMVPRFIRIPTSRPAVPPMMMVPSLIPPRLPRYAAPTCPPAFPRTRMNPSDISAPSQSDTFPETSMPALHVRAEVHAGVADDRDAAARHAAADPLDLFRVTADLELVAGSPSTVKKSSSRHCRFPR